jgi:hypothetical protein
MRDRTTRPNRCTILRGEQLEGRSLPSVGLFAASPHLFALMFTTTDPVGTQLAHHLRRLDVTINESGRTHDLGRPVKVVKGIESVSLDYHRRLLRDLASGDGTLTVSQGPLSESTLLTLSATVHEVLGAEGPDLVLVSPPMFGSQGGQSIEILSFSFGEHR